MDRPAGCSSRSRRSLIRRNRQGSLSRVPEEPAMDNSAAYTESTAGPAVFTCPSVIHTSPDRSVSLGTLSRSSGQSADWFVSSRTLAKTARPCSFYICFCFYICLCFYFCFCLRFYFFAVVSVFGFASLLFSFFTFFFFLIILSFILFLLSFFSYLFSLTHLMYHDDHSVCGEQNMQIALFSAQPAALQTFL